MIIMPYFITFHFSDPNFSSSGAQKLIIVVFNKKSSSEKVAQRCLGLPGKVTGKDANEVF